MTVKNNRTRVLLCAPNLSGGGAERMSLLLLEALYNNNFDVTMYVHERREGQLEPKKSLSKNIKYGVRGNYKRWHLLKHLFMVLKLSWGSDVIVGACEGRASALALTAGKILKRPVVLWLHADWNEFSKILSWRTKKAVSSSKMASAIVACSQGVADAHVEAFPKNKDLVKVIPNAVKTEVIRELSMESLPKTIQKLFERPIVLTVGRLNYQKGHDLLLKSHARAIQMGADYELVILGVGGDKQKLENLASDLDVSNSVHFLGFQENPYRFMAKSSIFVLSSRFEGMPLVLLEAIACRVPIISFDCPAGPSEILDEGKYGILVPPENIESMAAEIVELISNPERRLDLKKASGVRAEMFDMVSFGSSWSKIVEEAEIKGSAR